MSRLLVATRSLGKQREFRSLLAPHRIEPLFPDDVGIRSDPAEDGLECHETFEANARAKAHWFAGRAGRPALADDSGLEVDALGGQPGVRSKRFAGGAGPDHEVADANNAALVDRLRNIPDARRTARYRSVLVLAWPGGGEVVGTGSTEGRILGAPRGRNGFGYDPLFFSTELGATFGEASAAAKAAVSHRARALREVLERYMARGEPGLSRD